MKTARLRQDATLWVTVPVEGAAMERINLPFFHKLGANLHALASTTTVTKENRIDAIIAILDAQSDLVLLLANYSAITVCRPLGNELITQMKEAFQRYREMPVEKRRHEEDADLDSSLGAIGTNAKEFETVLIAELQTFAAYQVDQKGIYSISDLVERAAHVMPSAARQMLSDKTIEDLNQAGKCLAFDLATASGFHIMRSLESVIKTYCEEFKTKKSARNWNAYITELKKTNANPKTIAVLDQIRALHRNPTIHPEEVLTTDEATSLFGIAQSAIMSMVADIVKHQKAKVASTMPATQSGTGSSAE